MTLDAYSPTPSLRKEFQTRLEALRRLEKELRDWGDRDWGPTGQGPQSAEAAESDVEQPGAMDWIVPQRATVGEPPSRIASRFATALFSTAMLRLRGEVDDTWESACPTRALPSGDPDRVPRGKLVGGRYRISEIIARGGLAVVCRAVDEKRCQSVAVKILPAETSGFLRESLEVTQELDHPGILRVLDAGSMGKLYYFVTPFLEGTSLQSLLDAGASPRGALLLALRRAAAAVAYAHEHGVVHRDLKPGNLQVETDGRVVVLDWDLACRVGRGRDEHAPIVGTPLFMAPEQLRGEPVTPRSDVFSLGTILYGILTGTYPAEEARFVEGIAQRVLHEVPLPPSFVTDDVPAALDAIAVRALEKDPKKRFADAREFLEALEDA